MGHSRGARASDRDTEAVVEFRLDDQTVSCPGGFTVAAALRRLGHVTCRSTARTAAPRGVFCGMGVCFDCVMTVDGRPNVRTCVTTVRPGMHVQRQAGWGVVRRHP